MNRNLYTYHVLMVHGLIQINRMYIFSVKMSIEFTINIHEIALKSIRILNAM
jgi:hypothetical protein